MGLIDDIPIAVANEVVCAFISNELICLLLDVVHVEGTVRLRAVFRLRDLQSSRRVEGIHPHIHRSTRRPRQSVGIRHVILSSLNRVSDPFQTVACSKIVILALHAPKAELRNAFLAVVRISFILDETRIGIGSLVQDTAVLRKAVPQGLGVSASFDEPYAGIHIAVRSEVVALAIDLSPGLFVVGWAIIVASIGGSLHPNPFGQASRIRVEGKAYPVDGIPAFRSLIVAFEVKPAVRVTVPACDRSAVQKKEGVRPSVSRAGSPGNLAAIAADQRRTRHSIIMSDRRLLYVNRDLSHDRAIPHQPYRYRSFLSVGGKHPLRNRAEAVVGQTPCQAFGGKRGKIVCKIQAMRHYGHRAVRSTGIRMNRQGCVGKHAVTLGSFSDNNTVDDGAKDTVRGDGADRILCFAFAFGHEGSAAAAITMECVNTAQRDHQLSHLSDGQTVGNGRAATVHVADHQSPVCLDTDHTAGSGPIGIVHVQNVDTVTDDKREIDRDNRTFIPGKRIGHIPQINISLPINGHIGHRIGVDPRCAQLDALIDHIPIGRDRLIVQRGIHRADDVIAQLILIVGNRIG